MKIIILEKRFILRLLKKFRTISSVIFGSFIVMFFYSLLTFSCGSKPLTTMNSDADHESEYISAYVDGLAEMAFCDHAFKMITNQALGTD